MGSLYEGSYHLGSILGVPHFGKLPYMSEHLSLKGGFVRIHGNAVMLRFCSTWRLKDFVTRPVRETKSKVTVRTSKWAYNHEL